MKKKSKKGRVQGFTREEAQVYYSNESPYKSLFAHMMQQFVDDIAALITRDRSHFIVSHVTKMSEDEERAIKKILHSWIDTWQYKNICEELGFDSDEVSQRLKEKFNAVQKEA